MTDSHSSTGELWQDDSFEVYFVLRQAKYSWCASNSTDADNVIDAWQDISAIPCKVVLQR